MHRFIWKLQNACSHVRLPPASSWSGRFSRFRHARATDLMPADQTKKRLRPVPGALSPISRKESNKTVMRNIVRQRHAPGVLKLLQSCPDAGVPEFGKSFQRCGELRHHESLHAAWCLAIDRGVSLDRAAYGQLITAAARTARGANGMGQNDVDKQNALTLGKHAWSEMKRAGHKPTEPEYGAVLTLCARAGDSLFASQIWSELKDAGMVLTPSLLTQFLDAMAQHGGTAGWGVVDCELGRTGAAKAQPSTFTLAVLLDAAGTQHNLHRVEWAWRTLEPVVTLNALVYATLAKAFILCGQASKVPAMRMEMTHKGIQPMFRNFHAEVQALLLMSHATGTSRELLPSIIDVIERARNESSKHKVSASEVRQLDDMQMVAQRMAGGAHVPLSVVRVISWPW